MAKKKKFNPSSPSPVTRQALQTRGLSLRPLRPQRPGALQNLFNRQIQVRLQDVEDLRTLPQAVRQQRQYKRIDGTLAQYSPRPQRMAVQNRVPWLPESLRLQFHTPRQTLVCVRRQARRRVLFALHRAGKSGRKRARARWSAQSFIQCRIK